MSAQRQHQTSYTLEEYLEFENYANSRHEFYRGEIYAMAGTPTRHNRICLSAAATLRAQLRGRPCSALAMDQRLRVEAADLTTYPDVLVVCPPEHYSATDRIALLDATLIIEVLSPSTARYDQTSKFDFYSLIILDEAGFLQTTKPPSSISTVTSIRCATLFSSSKTAWRSNTVSKVRMANGRHRFSPLWKLKSNWRPLAAVCA